MAKKWGKGLFLNYIRMLEKEIAKETDLDRLAYLQYSLNNMRGTYFYYFVKDVGKKNPSFESQVYDVAYNFRTYPKYYEIIEEFYRQTSSLRKEIDESYKAYSALTSEQVTSLVDTHISLEDAIEGTRAFYSGFDETINRHFESIYAYRDGFFFAVPNNKPNFLLDRLDAPGDSFFISGLDKTLILVRNSEDQHLQGNLVHEYGHAIKNSFTPRYADIDGDANFFSEVESTFPELCSFIDNPLELPESVVVNYFYDRFTVFNNMADDLSSHRNIHDFYTSRKFKIEKYFRRDLRNAAELTKYGLDEALKADLEKEGVYALSYIVALELLHIYKQDKKAAVELFRRILEIDQPDDSLTRINSIVKLNEHAGEECKIILEDRAKVLSKVSQ